MKLPNATLTYYPINLAALPSAWVSGLLGDFMDNIRPGFASGAHNNSGNGIIHLRPMNISRKGYLDLSELRFVELQERQTVIEGDILFNNTNSPALVGKTMAIPRGITAAYSNHMTRIRPPLSLDPKFIALELHYLWSEGYFRHLCVNHVNQASVSASALASSVPLVVAPLAEQRRIVTKIETQFARLDAAEAALERARAKLKQYREASLVEVIGGPAEDVGSILEVPLTNGRSVGDRLDGFPVLRLTALRNGVIDTTQSKSGDWTAAEAQRYLIQEGDFLVARGNGSLSLVGRGGLVGPLEKSVAFPDTMIRIRCDRTRMIPEFLKLAWNSPTMRSQIETTARTTAGIYKISQRDIARFRIPVPPLHVQQNMVEAANELLDVGERAEVILNQNIAAAAFLRQSILQRAFSGQLVPQDPDDEPASVLLQRVAAERASAAPSRQKAAIRRTKSTPAEVQCGLL